MPSQEVAGDVGSPIRPGLRRPGPRSGASLSELVGYRAAVPELLAEVVGRTGRDDLPGLERTLADRLTGPDFTPVLGALPGGTAEAVTRLVREIRDYRPNNRSTARDLAGLIRIYLLSRIDVMWWGHLPGFPTDAALHSSAELVDLESLRRTDLLRFRYRRPAGHLLGRATRAVRHRVRPHRTPPAGPAVVPAGVGPRTTRTRPEVVALLNQLAVDLARRRPAPTSPLRVTSLARSLEHQHRLRALGYAAMLPSGHCLGYAMDIEMSWLRRFDAPGMLAALLRERQGWGDVNVIDEGQTWHLCVSPRAATRLRRDFLTALGG
ncbi:hypothetical protein [Plantactinospora endophytica]|uniref:Uncharacterized protein n=1 Tax=Plantactinospora endophytica TaxID=673535 RepID=A0ABQ4DXT4_9ACTN|nr:hypothetical protein [Plantactinospora endophytica]GIG87263.1 hypothetical protein Pen02_21990 [Plantactinospora endophytica]